MRSYVEWVNDPDRGFIIKSTWNPESKTWSGPGKMVLQPHQERVLAHCLTPKEDGKLPYTTIIYSCPKKSGKALAVDTIIPTPTGWTTMGEISVGDRVLGAMGQEVTVTYATDVMYDHPCHEVELESGEVFVADAEHVWVAQEFVGGVGQGRREITTQEMAQGGDWGLLLMFGSKYVMVEIRPHQSVPVRCIQVSDPDHLYAIGASFVLTHNTAVAASVVAWYLDESLDGTEAYCIANDQEQAEGLVMGDVKYHATQQGFRTLKSKIEFPRDCSLTALAQSYKSIAGSRHALTIWDELWAYCVAKDSKVLRLDLTWAKAGDLKPGDDILAFEEEISADVGYRSWVPAKVTANTVVTAPCVDVYMKNGEILTVTPHHKFLVVADFSYEVIWKQARYLVPGDLVMKAVDVADEIMVEPGEELIPMEWVEVTEVSAPHLEEIAMLTTDSATYISDGYCSHNTSETSRRAWDEMTPIPTVANSLRFIVTYAGFENESELLWELYEQCVGMDEHEKGRGERVPGLEDLPCWRNGSIFVYWDHEPRMPWQTEQYLNEQRITLRPSAYLRLHENQWVTSHEAFIPIDWWDDCTQDGRSAELWPDHPYRRFPVVIGVDAAVKRDCTAAVGIAYDADRGKFVQLFHRIWTPRDDERFDLERTLESYLLDAYTRYNVRRIYCDPTHLHQSLTKLIAKGVPIMEYPQTVTNMVLASQALYDALKYRNFEGYQDEELRSHIHMAVAENQGRGFRIVKSKAMRQSHVDGAIATALAVYGSAVEGAMGSRDTVVLASPFADMGKPPVKDEHIPWELRS